jgi:hypothetical protein
MPAGDSKNEPHLEKKPSFFFQCGRTITRKHTSAASGAKIQSHNAMQRWRLCSASALAQPRKVNKETTIKMVFSFPPEERLPFSQPRKDDGARRCDKGTFSVPQRVCDGKTQQTKVCCHGSFFIFISEPKPKPFSFQHVTITNLLERCMSCCITNNLLERCKFFQ